MRISDGISDVCSTDVGGSSVVRSPRLKRGERTIQPPDGADGFGALRCTARGLLVSDPGIQSHFAKNDIRVDLHRPGDIPVYRSGDLNCAAWAITAVVRNTAGGDRPTVLGSDHLPDLWNRCGRAGLGERTSVGRGNSVLVRVALGVPRSISKS